jgi:hypothetical protein
MEHGRGKDFDELLFGQRAPPKKTLSGFSWIKPASIINRGNRNIGFFNRLEHGIDSSCPGSGICCCFSRPGKFSQDTLIKRSQSIS